MPRIRDCESWADYTFRIARKMEEENAELNVELYKVRGELNNARAEIARLEDELAEAGKRNGEVGGYGAQD